MIGIPANTSRIEARFAQLARDNRGGLVTFITAGDPSIEVSQKILDGLPNAGADIIELGMPFTDPMADGPAIQAASLRALKAGATVKTTLEMVRRFRAHDDTTPLVLMGYCNPLMAYGFDRFVADAAGAGVDGLIIVDLPPEEDEGLRTEAREKGIDVIRLATPTTDDERLPQVLAGASGFLYYVAVAGITGGKSATTSDIDAAVARVRRSTNLPIAVGFGIRQPDQAAAIARVADAAVVGSAIVDQIKGSLDDDGKAGPSTVNAALDYVSSLSGAVRAARQVA